MYNINKTFRCFSVDMLVMMTNLLEEHLVNYESPLAVYDDNVPLGLGRVPPEQAEELPVSRQHSLQDSPQ